MNVLSLFDGISCGRVALERTGFLVTTYYASEIDKYAIQVAMKNFPSTLQLGDVRIVRMMAEAGVFGRVDLLIGGSPCQGFSVAGKQLAFDDPRSVLFFEFVRILRALQVKNPNIKFLLENVKMKQEHLDVITKYLGVQPVRINSSLVSAQTRDRFYWCNWPVTIPADRGIKLADIIESGEVDRDKSYCIDANYYKGGSGGLRLYLEKSRRQVVFDGPAPRNQSIRRLMVKQRPRGFNEGFEKEMDKCPTLTTSRFEQNIKVSEDGTTYRMLTPVECERLQTLPDGYTEGVSNTQRYKQLGNGWTVDVIAHIFGSMAR